MIAPIAIAHVRSAPSSSGQASDTSACCPMPPSGSAWPATKRSGSSARVTARSSMDTTGTRVHRRPAEAWRVAATPVRFRPFSNTRADSPIANDRACAPATIGRTICRMADEKPCQELLAAVQRTDAVHPASHGCTDCLAMAHGGVWVHLRLCLTCGHVGCCDSSPNRHARNHAGASDHAIVQSFEPGEDWRYCFLDDAEV